VHEIYLAQEQEFLEHLTDYSYHIPYSTTVGTGNTFLINWPPITTLQEGMAVSFKADRNVTVTPKLNWSASGEKEIKKVSGSPKFFTGGIYTVRYDGYTYYLTG